MAYLHSRLLKSQAAHTIRSLGAVRGLRVGELELASGQFHERAEVAPRVIYLDLNHPHVLALIRQMAPGFGVVLGLRLQTELLGSDLRVAWSDDAVGFTLQLSSNLQTWNDHGPAITTPGSTLISTTNASSVFARLTPASWAWLRSRDRFDLFVDTTYSGTLPELEIVGHLL